MAPRSSSTETMLPGAASLFIRSLWYGQARTVLAAPCQTRNCYNKFFRLGPRRHVFLITSLKRTLAITVARVRRECDRRREPSAVERTIPDFTDQTIAVLTRHSDVSHDDVRSERVHSSERVIGRRRNAGCCTLLR